LLKIRRKKKALDNPLVKLWLCDLVLEDNHKLEAFTHKKKGGGGEEEQQRIEIKGHRHLLTRPERVGT